jgi:hypothetical protein
MMTLPDESAAHRPDPSEQAEQEQGGDHNQTL